MAKGNKRVLIKPAEEVENLWKKAFFKGSQKLPQVVERLADDGYNFSLASVAKALERAPYLTRRGKRGSYEYIQTIPYKA